MSNSWDKYFSHYSDWDDAHCFNVRLELKFEDEIKSLGYVVLHFKNQFAPCSVNSSAPEA